MIASRRFFTAALLVVCAASCRHKHPTGPDDPEPEALQIICGASISVTITGASKPVTFALPTTTGGTQPVSVACTPASGSAFPLATTPVVCVATDAASRQAICGFDVTARGVQFGAKKFLAVGDSTTEGENGNGLPNPCPKSFTIKCDDTPNAYPVKLQGLFDASYPGQSINVAYTTNVGGNSTSTTLSKLQDNLSSANPEGLLLLTGYNDMLTNCGFGYSDNARCDQAVNDVQSGVRAIIRAAKAYPSVRYVFVGTLTPGRPGPRYIDPSRVQDVNEHIRSAVAIEGAVLVDLYPPFLGHESEYVSTDGLHLLPPGYQTIAQTFFDRILATVPQTNPQRVR